VPEAVDFESLIKVCRGSGKTLFMKIIVQSYPMQFIFRSYPLEAQRRIVRLLLGYDHDGNNELFPMFDDKVVLAAPYHLFVLHEILKIKRHANIEDILQKLNQNLSSEHLLLASLLDKTFLPMVIELAKEVEELDSNDPENKKLVIERMRLLIQRVKKENLVASMPVLNSNSDMAIGAAAAGHAMAPMDIVDIDGKLELSQEFEDDDDLIGDEEDNMMPVGA